MFDDTIAAIVTAMAPSGVGMIRVSGDTALESVSKIFELKGKKSSFIDSRSHTIRYGHIVDPLTGMAVDEVLVSVMKGPKSYTKEDVVEINAHGGMIVMQRILRLLLKQGVRMAEPGEFTKRAFLNGRIDLSQAEAVMDIINAQTEMSLSASIQQLNKSLSDQIEGIKQILLTLMAHIEAAIDYPEYDIEEVTTEYLLKEVSEIEGHIIKLLDSYDDGRMIKEGIKTVIVGKPNVGKSSLLNTLLKEQRAIVTDIPGTTRDVLEEYMNIHGIPLRLIDTAGIRETQDVVEKIGVSRSKEKISEADLVLLVLDGSDLLTKEDHDIMELIGSSGKKTVLLLNKMDLEVKLDQETLEKNLPGVPVIPISAKDQTGIHLLEEEIKRLFTVGQINLNDQVYVTNVRHKNVLDQALASINAFKDGIDQEMSIDCLSIDLKNVYEHIGEITGDSVSEDLIAQIFSQFCLGK